MTNAALTSTVAAEAGALLRRASDDLGTAVAIVRATQRTVVWESPAGRAAQEALDELALSIAGAAAECDEAAVRLHAAGGDPFP